MNKVLSLKRYASYVVVFRDLKEEPAHMDRKALEYFRGCM